MLAHLILSTILLGAQTLDFEMTPDEQKKTGVSRLSKKEKEALQSWIDDHYEKRAVPLASAIPEKGTIQENLKNGQYIRLSDGSFWNIHPKDTSITQSWITPAEVVVSQSGDANYPYKLTNTLTGSSVRAKKSE